MEHPSVLTALFTLQLNCLGNYYFNLKFFLVVGKSPLFEIRHVDADANGSCKSISLPEKNYLEVSDFTLKKDIDSSGIEYDDEDLDHSPKQSKKFSSKKSVKKRSSPVCVYIYKVYYLGLYMLHYAFLLEISSPRSFKVRAKVIYYRMC